MNSGMVFLSCLSVLLIFNWIYVAMYPSVTWNLTVGAVTGFVGTILALGIISGIQLFGSGLSGTSIKIIFGVGTLLNILFQITIGGFPIGMGLANNVLSSFSGGDIIGIGYFLTTIICIITIVSGLMVIIGGGGGD